MNIKNILIEKYKYSEAEAELMAGDLLELDPQLIPIFEKWKTTGDEKDDQEFRTHSIDSLHLEHGLNFFAALVTLDWIIKDPDTALPAIAEGIM